MEWFYIFKKLKSKDAIFWQSPLLLGYWVPIDARSATPCPYTKVKGCLFVCVCVCSEEWFSIIVAPIGPKKGIFKLPLNASRGVASSKLIK